MPICRPQATRNKPKRPGVLRGLVNSADNMPGSFVSPTIHPGDRRKRETDEHRRGREADVGGLRDRSIRAIRAG